MLLLAQYTGKILQSAHPLSIMYMYITHKQSCKLLALYLYRTKWVELEGHRYKPSCAVILGVEDDMPTFCEVNSIYVVDESKVVFEVTLFHSVLSTTLFCISD